MKTIFLAAVLSTAVLAPTAGCSLFDFQEPMVVTTQDNVAEGTPKEDTFVIPLEWIKPELQKDLEKSGKVLVMTPKSTVKDPTKPAIDVALPTDPNSKAEAVWSVAEIAVDVAKVFLPGLGVLEGLGYIFSKRKRENYNAAISAMVPHDGNVDIKGAIAGIAKALGFKHTEDVVVVESEPVKAKDTLFG